MAKAHIDSPYVIGSDLPPMPTLKEAQAAWRSAYIARMVSQGIDSEDAANCCDAVEFGPHGHNISQSPESAADDEMSYWSADE